MNVVQLQPNKVVVEVTADQITHKVMRGDSVMGRRVVDARNGAVLAVTGWLMPETVMHQHLRDMVPSLFDVSCELNDLAKQAKESRHA